MMTVYCLNNLSQKGRLNKTNPNPIQINSQFTNATSSQERTGILCIIACGNVRTDIRSVCILVGVSIEVPSNFHPLLFNNLILLKHNI